MCKETPYDCARALFLIKHSPSIVALTTHTSVFTTWSSIVRKRFPFFLSFSCPVSLSLPPINSLLYSVDYNCYYITYFDAPIVLELASESPFELGHSFLLLCVPGNFRLDARYCDFMWLGARFCCFFL